MTRIRIVELRLHLIVGAWPHERRRRQDVCATVELDCDTPQAAVTDDLADAVDYDALARDLVAFAEDSSYVLLEALAEALRQRCLAADPRVCRARVTLAKPAAIARARWVEVTADGS